MIRFLILGVVLALAGCGRETPSTTVAPASGPRSLHLSADFTGDGRPEDISIDFPESNIRKPFIWVLSIKADDGKVLYSERYDDTRIDDIVSDPEHVGDCKSYDECKRKYYFKDIPRRIGDCLKPSTTAWLREERLVPRLEEAARFDLEKLSFNEARTNDVISEMKVTLSNPGHASLCLPSGPDVTEPPMIWVAGIQKFITYYRP